MCVSCIFYVDWELEGQKQLRVGILLSKILFKLSAVQYVIIMSVIHSYLIFLEVITEGKVSVSCLPF